MSDKINQDDINKALWAACDTFRGTVSADTYKDFILIFFTLMLLFLALFMVSVPP